MKTLSSEMITQAEASPITFERMMEGIALKSFPVELQRLEAIDEFGFMQIQFSHDQLGPGKFIKHLSFSRQDQERPNDEIKKAFQEAFFGNAEDILEMPSTLPHVIQLMRFVIFDVRNN